MMYEQTWEHAMPEGNCGHIRQTITAYVCYIATILCKAIT